MERLSKREVEITELLAWGASKKEVADLLCISYRTVQNHSRNIFEKTGCSKVNELSAWWFCHRFHIPMNLSPLARKLTATLILAIYILGISSNQVVHRRVRLSYRQLDIRCERVYRKNSNDFNSYAA